MTKRPCVAMTPAERFRRALNFQPLDQVPTCEVWFAPCAELLGRKFPPQEALAADFKGACRRFAELYAEVATRLEHGVFSVYLTPFETHPRLAEFIAAFKDAVKQGVLVQGLVGGDACTFSLNCDMGAGKDATAFAVMLHERPAEAHREARRRCDLAKTRIRWYGDNGVDVIGFSNDYAFNSGPFLAPAMIREFIVPYLDEMVHYARELGLLTYLHSDGNIMEIIHDLARCGPHAFQSIDPTGGLNLKIVKEALAQYRIGVIGNVDCGILQRGTPAEIAADTARAMAEGKPGGGFVLSSSNCIYPEIPLANYMVMWETWRAQRAY